MADETEALRAEVAGLRAEVERLRAWQAGQMCAGACTCPHPTAAAPFSAAPCPVHSRPYTPLSIRYDATGCAGFAGQVYTITAP